jgi:galactokinase
MNRAEQLRARFRRKFGTEAAVYRAPGRVNLIGEHTDYNDGLVLPAAIGFSCWVAVAPRDDRRIVCYSENFDQMIDAKLGELKPGAKNIWSNYPLGVAWALEHEGSALLGVNLYIAGDVPLGAGLSSSAAIEVATGYALLGTSGLPIDKTKLALLCQKAENEFVGSRCGIMDQFISCYGQADHALLLDCRSLEMRALPVPPDMALVICNTMVRHELGTTEYNTRRGECEEAVRILQKAVQGVRALRDLSVEQVEEFREMLPEAVYRRARHVVTENARVLATAEALERDEIARIGPLMADSHRSLREDYEVSCPELDTMVEIAVRQPGVHGARLTGGGFGGCTINLVEAAHATEFQERVATAYFEATGLHPDIYICEASQGAEAVLSDAVDIAKPSAVKVARENP